MNGKERKKDICRGEKIMKQEKTKNYIVRFYPNVPNRDNKKYVDIDFKKYIRFHRFLVEFEYRGGYKWFCYDCLQENTPFDKETLEGGYSVKFYDSLYSKITKLITKHGGKK